MVKNPEWNMALEGQEDWKAAMSSEVFRNYLKITEATESKYESEFAPLSPHSTTSPEKLDHYINLLKKEKEALIEDSKKPSSDIGRRELAAFDTVIDCFIKRRDELLKLDEPIISKKMAATEEQLRLNKKNKDKFKKDTDEIMRAVDKAEDTSDVPEPIIPNLPYGEYQEHVQTVHDKPKGKSTYDEFFPDYKVYHKQSNEEYLAMKKLAEEAEEMDIETEPPVIDEETPHDSSVECDYKEMYETGAGESEYLDIGLTNETEQLMESGIDYVEKEPISDDISIEEPEDLEDDEMKEEEEIKEAEVALGLDKNIFYILRKMGR